MSQSNLLETDTARQFVGHIVLDVPAEHPTLRYTQIAQALATIVQVSEPRFAVGIFGGGDQARAR